MCYRHSSLGVSAGVGAGVGASKGVVDEQGGGGEMMNKGAGPWRGQGHEWEWARAVGVGNNGGWEGGGVDNNRREEGNIFF